MLSPGSVRPPFTLQKRWWLLLQLVFLAALFTGGNGRNTKVPWWQIKVAKSQGPNACVVEEVPAIGRKYYTECKYWPIRKVCGHETLIRYECCEGFQQIPNEEGCVGVKPLKDVVETAKDHGATKFAQFLEDSGIAEELRGPGTFTVFAPIDSGFNGTYGNQVAMKIRSFMPSPNNPVLRYHISEKKRPSDTFSADNEILTQYDDRVVRVSKYSTGMETVNCALISRKDQHASNGVVHLIDSPLDPTLYMDRDVAEVVIEDGRFHKLSQAMERCGFLDRLREPGKTYTLLAPSDEAFLKIPPARLEKMIADRDSCTALLENHVVPHVMCLPVITEEVKSKTLGGNGRAGFDCDENGHTINSKRLSGELMLGNNGVVYMLDDVLIPDRARTLLELAESRFLVTFAQLVKVAGLEDTFNNFGDYTLFAPIETAFDELDEDILEAAKRDTNLARRLVLYHGTQGRIFTNDMENNQNVMSLDEENPLRLAVYRKKFGVENAILEQKDIEGFNGVLHTVDRVLFPAQESAGDILRKSATYSSFLQAMENVMQSTPEALDLSKGEANSHYTFFVPSDEAFNAIGEERRRLIQNDAQYRAKVLKNHVCDDMVSSNSFYHEWVYEVPTRQNALGVQCSENGAMRVNNATVVEKDIVSANGIIHVVDRVLLPDTDFEESGHEDADPYEAFRSNRESHVNYENFNYNNYPSRNGGCTGKSNCYSEQRRRRPARVFRHRQRNY